MITDLPGGGGRGSSTPQFIPYNVALCVDFSTTSIIEKSVTIMKMSEKSAKYVSNCEV